MQVLRTPDERFAGLPGYSFEPRYVEVGDGLRVYYVDDGPRHGPGPPRNTCSAAIPGTRDFCRQPCRTTDMTRAGVARLNKCGPPA